MFLSGQLDQTRKKLKAQSANILTLFNLTLGAFSILFTIRGELNIAVIFIFLAALCDRFDGMVARKLQIESELGKQLDSMCDIISFGVAPALLLYEGVLFNFGFPGAFFTVLYIGCGAFRLARFNITESTGFFTGVPITAAGCLLTLSYLSAGHVSHVVFMFLILLLSFMMVSNFKIKKV